MYRLTACALALLMSAATLPALAQDADDPTVFIEEADPAMNAAIASARATLPEFWLHFANPGDGEGDFNLKVAISEGGQTEHLWCNDIIGDWRGASCVIANDANIVQSVGLGDRIIVDNAMISDWMFIVDGKIRGARTLRAMLPQLSPEEAAQYEELLLD